MLQLVKRDCKDFIFTYHQILFTWIIEKIPKIYFSVNHLENNEVFSDEVHSNFLRFYKLCLYIHCWCCLWYCRQKFTKSTGKHCCWNLVFQNISGQKISQNLCWSVVFNKVTSIQAAALSKSKLWHFLGVWHVLSSCYSIENKILI